MSPENLLTLHIFSCFAMTGLIWFVQIVHYPLFPLLANASEFHVWHRVHTQRTSFVVIPLMLIELLSGVAILVYPPPMLSWDLRVFNLILLVGLWLSTALVQVPLHRRLQRQESRQSSARWLILTNWARTIFWTLRSLAWILFLQGLFIAA